VDLGILFTVINLSFFDVEITEVFVQGFSKTRIVYHQINAHLPKNLVSRASLTINLPMGTFKDGISPKTIAFTVVTSSGEVFTSNKVVRATQANPTSTPKDTPSDPES
jgi:hypothetical protein